MSKKIKNLITKILLGTAVFNIALISTELNKDFSKIISDSSNVVYAAQADEIILNGSVYSKDAEYYQDCLNKLGYKDYDNNVLDVDGYFGGKSKSALDKFLKAQGFTYFSSAAKDKLIALAQSATNTANTTKADEVKLDGSVYDEAAEYYQYCLNKLGYKDSDNNVLDTDGHFGGKSRVALDKFLKAQGFSYFSNTAKDKLMSLAENTANKSFNSGFALNNNKLTPTAFVYSSISNINNSHDPFYSMSVLKEFPYIITMKPDEMSYKSKRVADFIKAKTKIFGYVNLGPDNPTANKRQWKQADLNKVKAEIDSIAKAGWYGVFVDQAGYDFNETRERQNAIVDYIHSKGLKCMVNAWFADDVLGSKVDKVANPKGIPSHLNSSDWYLVESFFTDGDSYRGDASYIQKYLNVKKYRDSMKINVATLSYKRDAVNWQQAASDVKTSYVLAQCLGFNGWWFGKTDNSDNLLYGKDPNVNLGKVIKPLQLQSGNKYVAETENYKVEYYAQSTPVLKLIKK